MKMNKTTKIILTSVILTIYLFSIIGFASALTVSSVDVSPSEVSPGGSFNIRVHVENNDNTDIENVVVSLNLQNLPFSSDNLEVSYDEILEDKGKTADFNLKAYDNAKSEEYQIPIVISYTDPDEPLKQKTRNAVANIKVSSAPEVDIDLGDNYLIQGQEGKINVKVINKGVSDIKFLEVKIGSLRANLLSSDRVYIGDLDSNDFDTAEFSVIAKPSTTASSSMNVPVTLIYRDVFNKEYTKEFNENVKVYSTQEAINLGLIKKSNTTIYIIGAVAIIVIWMIYRRIKKRRKMKMAGGMWRWKEELRDR